MSQCHSSHAKAFLVVGILRLIVTSFVILNQPRTLPIPTGPSEMAMPLFRNLCTTWSPGSFSAYFEGQIYHSVQSLHIVLIKPTS
ncbi:hypothetical protein F4825DRAFT_401245 [Nemania diffusa]|nr:hypothetical protein F4825DRAFT_401245 [Nemania diffusa]